jgi:hypothetical protein
LFSFCSCLEFNRNTYIENNNQKEIEEFDKDDLEEEKKMGGIKLIRSHVNKRVYIYIYVCKCILCDREKEEESVRLYFIEFFTLLK